MEILWYGNSVSVLQLLDPSANVTVLAKSKDEALVVGRIRYGDAFPKVFNLECSEEGEATKLPQLQSSKVAIAACVRNETDMATVVDIASKMDKIFAVVIAGPMVPDVIAHGEMTGWSCSTKDVLWELVGSIFAGKTSFIAMVRKVDRAEKLQQLLEKSSKDHVGYENSVYNPQPASPSSTLTPVLQQPGANAGKRRFIEDALTELRRTGDGVNRPLFIEGEKAKRQCIMKPPLCNRRSAVLMRYESQDFLLGPHEFACYLGWREHSLNMHLLPKATAQHILGQSLSKGVASIMLAVLNGVMGAWEKL
ncbi:unnamed protein product [Symbiodinium microadriaticum]|nr:unnamed protein product [Symbiodinium microadriaticum]